MKNSEEKEIKNLKKKAEKKLKEVRVREAKLKLGQNSLERQQTISTDEKKIADIGDDNHNLHPNPAHNLPDPNIQLSNPTHSPAILVPSHQHLHPVEDLHCQHDSQCVLRAPHPPPHDPLTLKQYELQLLAMDSTTVDLVSFTSADPTSTDPTSPDSGNQDEHSSEQTELLELLEAFSERTLKKLDDFDLKFK